ncbi:Fe-S cluster assembly protein HesB [Candidatus Thorarchaeota archaeon]|nr:MAG: Fe-S cluster assembly protein HesB [Candidatus Thorarchaeota archaeon]
MNNQSQESIKHFQDKIMSWWKKNKRDLPWRVNPSPYEVLVSEIMLQQTQVSRVVPKYLEFLKEFPTLEHLASANTKHLLTVWSGLGYNRRAIWLKEVAGEIVRRKRFPEEVDELRELKGIGPYTSRSILIFAFNRDLAAVDTNIRRIFIALGFAEEATSEKELQRIADALLLKGRSSDWHNALMDYGSSVLTSSSTGIEPTSKQPQFSGSTRKIRGLIVQMLTKTQSLSVSEIASQLASVGESSECLNEILNQLIQDNLVECFDADRFQIPE